MVNLQKKVQELEESGAEATAVAPLYAQLSTLYIAQGETQKAAEALAQVAQLAEAAGELTVAAQTKQALGVLLAQGGDTDKAERTLLEALALYEAGESKEKATAVAVEILSQWPQLRQAFTPYLVETANLPPEVELERLWAEVRTAVQAGNHDVAEERLATAVAFARDHNLLDETKRTLLANLLGVWQGEFDPAQLETLLTQSETQLPEGVLSEPLALAMGYLQGGALEPAIEQARQVRLAARETSDPLRVVRYMLASAVLAEAHNARGERVQVLAAWLTCRIYLEANLGTAATTAIDQILDSLQARWGVEEMNTAVAEYQAYVAMHGQFQA